VRKSTQRNSGCSPATSGIALVVDHDQRAVTHHHWALLGEIQRHHRDVFGGDVLPDVKGERKRNPRIAAARLCGAMAGLRRRAGLAAGGG
jgi:hypothetical protein